MWIGLVFVILTNGQVMQDAAGFDSEAECKKAAAEMLKVINDPKTHAAGYKIECIDIKSLKKPGVDA